MIHPYDILLQIIVTVVLILLFAFHVGLMINEYKRGQLEGFKAFAYWMALIILLTVTAQHIATLIT